MPRKTFGAAKRVPTERHRPCLNNAVSTPIGSVLLLVAAVPVVVRPQPMIAAVANDVRALLTMIRTPVLAALETAVTIVVLRWELALIARRQVTWILRIV